MEKNYVILKEVETGKIISIHLYDNEKISIQKIKDKISESKETNSKNHYTLIENLETIEILNHVFRYEDNIDLKDKCERLEEAIEDIEQITRQFT